MKHCCDAFRSSFGFLIQQLRQLFTFLRCGRTLSILLNKEKKAEACDATKAESL
jgi:hypothetical protein